MKEDTINALDAFVCAVENFAVRVAGMSMQGQELYLTPLLNELTARGKELRDQLQQEDLS